MNSREKEASDAYLKFLQKKGAPSSTLYRRSRFLDVFMSQLQGKTQSRKSYAFALEDTLAGLPQEEKNNALNTAREYFPFWMNDIKAIAMFNKHYGFSTEDIVWEPKHATLQALTEHLDTEVFDVEEKSALKQYIQTIVELGAPQSIINTRSKFAKIILIRLRDAPIKNRTTYRISVDMTLPLFKTQEVRDLYLEVVREFFYYWENNPNAEELTFGKN